MNKIAVFYQGIAQSAFTYSKSVIKTLEKSVKFVQS